MNSIWEGAIYITNTKYFSGGFGANSMEYKPIKTIKI